MGKGMLFCGEGADGYLAMKSNYFVSDLINAVSFGS